MGYVCLRVPYPGRDSPNTEVRNDDSIQTVLRSDLIEIEQCVENAEEFREILGGETSIARFHDINGIFAEIQNNVD